MREARLDAVLFDLDGTLVDTLAPLRLAYHRFLERRGRAGTDEEFARWVGPPLDVVVAGLALAHGLTEANDALVASYVSEVERSYVLAPLFPSVLPLLDELAARGVAVAVVTSSPAKLARPLLAALDVLERFRVVICGDDVEHGKPAGDGYFAALRQLGVRPERAIAVEDSARGVEAARAGGLRCVGIGGASARAELVRSGASVVARDFAEAKTIVHALLDGPGRIWSTREVLVRRAADLAPLDEKTAARVEAAWTDARRDRPALFDGRLVIATEVRDEGTRLLVEVTEVPYRYYLAQHRGVALGLTPLAVSGVVVPRLELDDATRRSSDELPRTVVLGRRSSTVTQHAGAWELIPSGSVDGERIGSDGIVDVRGQLLEELCEELGVKADQVSAVEVLGLIESIDDAVLDVAFRLEVHASEAALVGAGAAHAEYDSIRLEDLRELEAELEEEGGRRFVPTVGPLVSLIRALQRGPLTDER